MRRSSFKLLWGTNALHSSGAIMEQDAVGRHTFCREPFALDCCAFEGRVVVGGAEPLLFNRGPPIHPPPPRGRSAAVTLAVLTESGSPWQRSLSNPHNKATDPPPTRKASLDNLIGRTIEMSCLCNTSPAPGQSAGSLQPPPLHYRTAE